MPPLNTYHRRVQLGASRRRLEDAKACLQAGRWTAAMYLGGYAIECALKAYICLQERKDDFQDVRAFRERSLAGRGGHNLRALYDMAGAPVMRPMLDPGGEFHNARRLVLETWYPPDRLRYSNAAGNQIDAAAFVRAVELLHRFLMEKQGER